MTSVPSEPRAALSSLLDILGTVERPGDYVAWGSLESVTPRIDIEGIGPLSFPLPESQAKQLIAISQRAPYGRGGKTLVDTDVRKVWQIPPGKVVVGERWHKTMKDIARAASLGLGVDGTVRAELYKLLVYDEGSFFLPHRDTEKADGMFATLVVVLPSVHRGGQLVVRHKDQSTTLSLGQGDLAEVSWAAFYTDCLHELLPVTSGYRVALVYNLVRPAGALRAPDHSAQAERVARVLDAWKASPEDWPTKVALTLEHRYTPAGLSFAGLKGADAGMASVLVEAGQRAGFAVHLAMVSIHESGSAEENHSYGRRRRWEPQYDDDHFEVIEVLERATVVEGFRTPDDTPAGLGPIPIDEEEILPEGALDKEEPDEQHYHEATGNEGASFERTYRRAAVVLWPAGRRLAVLAQASPISTVPLLEQLADSAPEEAHMLGKHMVAGWISPPDWEARHHKLIARVLAVLAKLQMADDIERFVHSQLEGPSYDGSQNDALVECCSALTPERASALLAGVVARASVGALGGCVALLLPLAQKVGAEVARPVAAAVLHRLPTDPALLGQHRWQHPRAKPDFVEALLRGLWAVGDADLATTAVERLLPWYDMDAALLPAALALADIATDTTPGWSRLRGAIVDHLTQRVATPLAPPKDLARPASWGCSCSDCVEFRAFLDSPTEAQWTLKAGKERRRHIENQITFAQIDVDTATVARGNPHSLVCTKNARSYEARVAQRRRDLVALEVLGAR